MGIMPMYGKISLLSSPQKPDRKKMLITNTTVILDAPKAENVVTNRTLKHALM
jgi:hypothetical protein